LGGHKSIRVIREERTPPIGPPTGGRLIILLGWVLVVMVESVGDDGGGEQPKRGESGGNGWRVERREMWENVRENGYCWRRMQNS
jgi:hypothetical protein